MTELSLFQKFNKPVCLALGFFDSVHLGHRGLIERTKELANKLGAEPVVVTFNNNAYKQFNPDAKLIYTYNERLLLLSECGIEYVLPLHFDKEFKNKSKDEFLNSLADCFNISAFICGYDYLFGSNGEGDTAYLTQYAAKCHSMCDIVQPILVDNVRVSSSMIKNLLLDGKIDEANNFLGSSFFMNGEVIEGRGVGHLFGFPTANLSFFKDKLLIKNGVYLTNCFVDGVKYKSVTNVGSKPTFNEMSVSVESMLDECSANLYGKTMRVEFLKFLRPIKKFDTPQELYYQVQSDMKTT